MLLGQIEKNVKDKISLQYVKKVALTLRNRSDDSGRGYKLKKRRKSKTHVRSEIKEEREQAGEPDIDDTLIASSVTDESVLISFNISEISL